VTAAQLAKKLISQCVAERIDELRDQWQQSEDKDERELLHCKVRATIELEDHLHGRLDRIVD